jgi:hypothetical protein
MRSLTTDDSAKDMSMVARTLLTASAVGLAVSLLAAPATAGEAPRAQDLPRTALVAHEQLFRQDIESYVRELGRQMRAALSEDLRRELKHKAAVTSKEPRTIT